MRAAAVTVALAATLAMLAPGARSAPPPSVPEPATQEEAEALSDREAAILAQERNLSYWRLGRERWFMAVRIDVGFLYFQPRLSFGYGLPHHDWIGLDANPIADFDGYGAYAGLRVALPEVNIRLGGRFFQNFRHSYLEPRDSYDRDQVELRDAPLASYSVIEAELTSGFGLGPGALFGELAGYYYSGIDDVPGEPGRSMYLYDQRIKTIIAPPWVGRARIGYSVGTWLGGAFNIGPVIEVVFVPARTDGFFLRAGLVARMRLFSDLEIRGTFIPAILTPDALGLEGGHAIQLGIRWRWATGHTPSQ